MIRRVVSVGVAITVVLLASVGISGHWLFTDAADDELQSADVVVVLGGEHDAREKYGLALAQRIGAHTVLLSNPYPADDPVMSELCNKRIDGIRVICRRPDPATTRGEAMMVREEGREQGWQRIVVVTWRFHLLRARMIFQQCYSDEPGRIIMRAVPRQYDLPFAIWEYIYFYQYTGLLKAMIQGSCV